MKRIGALFWRSAPARALAEGALACAVLLLPVYPAVIDAPPVPRSLYLVLLPILCAVVAGLRLRLAPGRWYAVLLKESGLALLLGLGVTGIVLGLLAALGATDTVRFSYAGTGGTRFFLAMAAPEFLAVRLVSWTWRRWDQLRRRRYVWALTHASLSVAGGVGLVALVVLILALANAWGSDISGIPPDSLLAKTVFWVSMFVLFAVVLGAAGVLVFLPPSALFSFLVARRLTARVEKLAAVTRALRGGSLSARVPVQGEDEIAQLQADFNAMAEDLQASVQALQAEKDKVWQLMEARRELVAEVSHELRNPTAIIQGYTDGLRRGWKERAPEAVERDLETIQYEALRLQTILDDLLTAAQAESGHLRVALCPVDVTALARRLVETFSGLAWDRKRAQVSLLAPEAPALALADPLRLEQVLVNLLQNAVRHTSPGGLVTVEIQAVEDQPGDRRVRIEVADTGEGIPPEDLPHIWEKYYQAGSPQQRAQQLLRTQSGAGLGLALVKELTEAMDGSVNVESCPGQGSSFLVILPSLKE